MRQLTCSVVPTRKLNQRWLAVIFHTHHASGDGPERNLTSLAA